jgi:hypothetical protein
LLDVTEGLPLLLLLLVVGRKEEFPGGSLPRVEVEVSKSVKGVSEDEKMREREVCCT